MSLRVISPLAKYIKFPTVSGVNCLHMTCLSVFYNYYGQKRTLGTWLNSPVRQPSQTACANRSLQQSNSTAGLAIRFTREAPSPLLNSPCERERDAGKKNRTSAGLMLSAGGDVHLLREGETMGKNDQRFFFSAFFRTFPKDVGAAGGGGHSEVTKRLHNTC